MTYPSPAERGARAWLATAYRRRRHTLCWSCVAVVVYGVCAFASLRKYDKWVAVHELQSIVWSIAVGVLLLYFVVLYVLTITHGESAEWSKFQRVIRSCRRRNRAMNVFIVTLALLAAVNVAVVVTQMRWRVCIGSNLVVVFLVLQSDAIPVCENTGDVWRADVCYGWGGRKVE